INEILDFYTNYWIEINTKVLKFVDVDYCFIWEDLAYRNGPIISPFMFRKFIFPFLKKFINSLKEIGVQNFIVDTDGNFEILIELFVKAGISGFEPFEVQAGMNIEKIRNLYPNLVIMGGIDKISIAKGKENIKKEINKVKRMLRKGRFIPTTDHAVPPDVSFENYCFFRNELRKIIK
ncbi:MAG: hypothetical protein M1479_07950, partial [Actinobacteria bacterium]|nr:hypothetical protein [Actinomycetota bacterium]